MLSNCTNNSSPCADFGIGWIIDNQLSRRNLPKYISVTLALKREPLYIEIAKANQRMGGENPLMWKGSQISEKAVIEVFCFRRNLLKQSKLVKELRNFRSCLN